MKICSLSIRHCVYKEGNDKLSLPVLFGFSAYSCGDLVILFFNLKSFIVVVAGIPFKMHCITYAYLILTYDLLCTF